MCGSRRGAPARDRAHCGGNTIAQLRWVSAGYGMRTGGLRPERLRVQVPKSRCLTYGHYFRQPLPGILRYRLAAKRFRKRFIRIADFDLPGEQEGGLCDGKRGIRVCLLIE